jgi:hypothetical protein
VDSVVLFWLVLFNVCPKTKRGSYRGIPHETAINRADGLATLRNGWVHIQPLRSAREIGHIPERLNTRKDFNLRP